jgi:hypothetical protein
LDGHDMDVEIAELLAEEGGDSVALARWKERLSDYVDRQGALDALRLRSQTEAPWPAVDNPMLGYLSERSTEIAAEAGIDAALAWLVRNAWFEGAIAERARIAGLIDQD